MPKRKERMAGYIRESDERLIAGTTTMESAINAVRDYGAKEGYLYDTTNHEYKEAISAYVVPYNERERLLAMLDAAKRHEFDVLVVTEIRAIARRQVEVLVIYDILQKYGVRLETIKEKFGDDAMSKAILSLRAMFAEIEVEQSKMRMARGRRDRIAIGQAPNAHPKPAYGYKFIDTPTEIKGGYEFNQTIIYVDREGSEWSEYKVIRFIFDLLLAGYSLRSVARTLNEIGIPTAKKALKGDPHWQKGSISRIIINPIYVGEVWANRWQEVPTQKGKGTRLMLRPKEEWIRIPNCPCPALLTREEWDAVQKQKEINRIENLANNAHPKEELGLLRNGYIFCGICQHRMLAKYPSEEQRANRRMPYYRCQDLEREKNSPKFHTLVVMIDAVDREARAKIVEILLDPLWIRARVAEKKAEIKKKKEKTINEEDIQATIDGIKERLKRLYKLAEYASDDDTIEDLAHQMNGLESQKRQAEALLFQMDEDKEKEEELEKEIVKFEKWAEDVRPQLTDPTYVPTWDELRLAIRILGIRATVFPDKPEYKKRFIIDATVPEVMKKMDIELECVAA